VIIQASGTVIKTGRRDVSFLISDLYSVAPSKTIEWFLYVFDISDDKEGTVEGRYVRANMLEIGRELGASAAIITGADGKPRRQVYDFLSQHLDSEIKEAVQLVTSGCMSMLATRRPLPHTDAMGIIPLSNRSKPLATEPDTNRARAMAPKIARPIVTPC
jgi:hypothetical protein